MSGDGVEENELAERILCDLASILRNNALIESFDIIAGASDGRENKSPIYLVQNNLAIESWCVPRTYPYANRVLKDRPPESDRVILVTNFLLLINPELQTAWNLRCRLYLQNKVSLQQELLLSQLALSKKPKNADALCHRKWVLQQEMPNFTIERRQSLLHSELSLCDQLVESYFSNYNAWDYRRHIMHSYVEGAPLIIENELQRSKEFMQTHVSDYSGMSYRQYVLLRVNSKPLFSFELEFISELIHGFPGHEALWMHRRFCILSCLGLLRYTDKKTVKIVALTESNSKISEVQTSERDFVEDVFGAGELWQRSLCERHVRWLKDYVDLQLDVSLCK